MPFSASLIACRRIFFFIAGLSCPLKCSVRLILSLLTTFRGFKLASSLSSCPRVRWLSGEDWWNSFRFSSRSRLTESCYRYFLATFSLNEWSIAFSFISWS